MAPAAPSLPGGPGPSPGRRAESAPAAASRRPPPGLPPAPGGMRGARRRLCSALIVAYGLFSLYAAYSVFLRPRRPTAPRSHRDRHGPRGECGGGAALSRSARPGRGRWVRGGGFGAGPARRAGPGGGLRGRAGPAPQRSPLGVRWLRPAPLGLGGHRAARRGRRRRRRLCLWFCLLWLWW